MPTPTHIDLKTIAVGCVYLLTNKATLYFPSTARSHPSHRVVVDLANRPLFRESDRAYFPFFVWWGAWHEAVVPVLDNKDVQVIVRTNTSLRVHQNRTVIGLGHYKTLIAKVQDYLTDSFVTAGYLPTSFSPEATASAVQDALPPVVLPEGEPLVLNPLGPVGPDVDDLYHPDGTPRLSYNIVDAG